MDADLEKARDNGINAVVEFFDGFVVDVAVDASDDGALVLAHGFEEVFGLFDSAFHVGGAIVRNDDEEGLVHNVSFFGENVDELEVVVHEDAEEHIVVVAAHFRKTFDIGANVNFLGADKDLDSEVEGVEEVLVAIFDTLAFGFGHKVKVDGLAGDDGAEGAVFHDDEAVAEFGEEESGLGGEGVFNDGSGRGFGGGGDGGNGLLGGGGRGLIGGRLRGGGEGSGGLVGSEGVGYRLVGGEGGGGLAGGKGIGYRLGVVLGGLKGLSDGASGLHGAALGSLSRRNSGLVEGVNGIGLWVHVYSLRLRGINPGVSLRLDAIGLLLDGFDGVGGIVGEVGKLGLGAGGEGGLRRSGGGSGGGGRFEGALTGELARGGGGGLVVIVGRGLDGGAHLIDDFGVVGLLFLVDEGGEVGAAGLIEHVGGIVGFGIEFVAHRGATGFDSLTLGVDDAGEEGEAVGGFLFGDVAGAGGFDFAGSGD